jgi:putative N6-adenine-specific DNA methylase
MFLYQQSHAYFAQIADGFEALAQKELEALGATAVKPAYRGIHFCADPEALYRINYHCRMVSRVLAPLLSFRCKDRRALYREAKTINWSALFSVAQTFGIFANVSDNEQLRHSKFAALCLKDAVADQFRDRLGKRPNVDKTDPDIWIHLLIQREHATISLDTSGGSLHKRGYRKASVAAPMKETLAAAMVALSGWQADRPLYDPMCGSGTLLCEAVLTAARIPAGYLRTGFGFQRLPDFDERLWQKVKQHADAQIRPLPKGLVAGSDLDGQAVTAALSNCRQLPGGQAVEVTCKDYETIASLENCTIVCNPPYGIRMSTPDQLGPFYKALGDFLKQRCRGSEAYIYFGNREMIKKIGLKPAWKKPMRNAGLDGRVVKYEMY